MTKKNLKRGGNKTCQTPIGSPQTIQQMYKDNEYSNLMDAMTQTSQNNAQLKEMLKEEQEKCAILIEALEFYADESHLEMKYSIGNEGNYPLGKHWNDTMSYENGIKAREAIAKTLKTL
jgi:hypothetical protein